ncbi:MAG: hypothetical protein F6K41_15150 [Symploca sp. SIO3E6]|nr:hypothetical protein [Caldora sp. SIO3E6]
MKQVFVGCDVCKDHIVCWPLTERPKNVKQLWREQGKTRSRNPKEDELSFYFTQGGINDFLRLNPAAVALEPTGMYYSALIAKVCEVENIAVYWVGHSEVKHHRLGHKLPDKNDLADALALCSYLWDNYGRDEMFLQFSPGIPKKLRENYLHLQSLNRMQSPIINRLRQQLAEEFPEVSLRVSVPNDSGLAPLWAWLAGHKVHPRTQAMYEKLWAKSVSSQYGGNISYFTRKLATQLCNFHLIEREIEEELARLLCSPVVEKYRRVMEDFGMKSRTQAIFISQIYPISKYDSLPQFKKRLGCAGVEDSSGDETRFKSGSGSKMCRSAWYLWVLTVIASKKSRPLTPQCVKVAEYYDKQAAALYGSEEAARSQTIKRELKSSQRKIKNLINNQMKPLIKKEQAANFDTQLELLSQLLMSNIEQSLKDSLTKGLKQTEVRKGFGNLIIMRTAGYACKLLFKELKRCIN